MQYQLGKTYVVTSKKSRVGIVTVTTKSDYEINLLKRIQRRSVYIYERQVTVVKITRITV